MGKNVIVACDFDSKEKLIEFLDKMEGTDPNFYCKIGMELFDAGALQGFDPVSIIKDRGHKVFLDLKLKDIPNTVAKTVKVLATSGVDMINVHADGGYKMMKGVVDAINEVTTKDARPILLGVTVLTSMSEEELKNEIGINNTPKEQVVRLAKLCKYAGLDGVVCSPEEVTIVKDSCGEDFITVTPGIRFNKEKIDDQTRIATPVVANYLGSDYIVVGRPITQAIDPIDVYNKCKKDFVKDEFSKEELYEASDYLKNLNTKQKNPSDEVARKLIEADAFKVNTEDPYLLKSGIASPLYCNCRDLYKNPIEQKIIMDYLAELIMKYYPDCEAIFGTPMSAISFGALVAERLGVPFGFVREKAKDHGLNTTIEGPTKEGTKIVQVEDLITSGTSSLQPVKALRSAGLNVLGVAGIVDNNFVPSSKLIEEDVEYHTITTMSKIAHYAGEAGIITRKQFEQVKMYEDNPKDESWMSLNAEENIKKKRLIAK